MIMKLQNVISFSQCLSFKCDCLNEALVFSEESLLARDYSVTIFQLLTFLTKNTDF